MNTVKWPQSYDPNIASYKLQSSGDAATWVALATVAHAIPGANWDAVNSLFYYDDPAGSGATWYRIATVDTLAVQGDWSEPLQAQVDFVPQWSTAGSIISDAASEIGLGPVSDPYSSTDPNIVQMCSLLKSLGRDLVFLRGWSHLRGEHSFTTVAGQQDYPLPNDFDSMIPQTWWNNTDVMNATSPVGPEVWTYLNNTQVGGITRVVFRVASRVLSIYPSTSDGETISFEYNRKLWVSVAGSPNTLTSDAPARSSDLCWFDPLLLVRGLKLLMLKAKGFDSTSAAQEYSRTLELAKSHDTPAPALGVTGGTPYFKFIDGGNVNDTGYGS